MSCKQCNAQLNEAAIKTVKLKRFLFTCWWTTLCQHSAMPAMLLAFFILGLALDEEDEEVTADDSLFFPSLPSKQKTKKTF